MQDLKQALQTDLTTLKHLNLGVMPAKTYYRALFSGFIRIYLLFVGLQLLACLFASQTGAWEQDFSAVLFVKMLAGVIFSSLFFMLFMQGHVKNYVIFKHQLQSHLETGAYLHHKLYQGLQLYFTLFGSIALLSISLFHQDMTFFAGLAAFIFSSIAIVIVIEWELSRIGIGVLSSAIVEYFRQVKQG